MGLRFRKSISIMPGVRLNFGKTGMSVSAGVPGFRKTFHTSGKVTTSVGIPGTGIYYVDTKNTKKQSNNARSSRTIREEPVPRYDRNEYERTAYEVDDEPVSSYLNVEQEDSYIPESNYILSTPGEEPMQIEQLDYNSLKSIHKTSDDSIDWTEVLVSATPPDATYNQQMWGYYHSMAMKVLSGDIDTYLQLIYEVNPLDDLLSYGSGFEFGTDDPRKIEVEFSINEKALETARRELSVEDYNNLLQDYVCSVCIRVARDMFALLPVKNTVVHAVLKGDTIISVDFDRPGMSKVKFGYIDPSDTLIKFRHNMDFDEYAAFKKINNLM